MSMALAMDHAPLASEVSTTLGVGASAAYEIFADTIEIPRWLPLIQKARVVDRYPDGRARRVSFTRKLERGSLGYTLEYEYTPATYTVTWEAPSDATMVLSGEARFVPLSPRACMMLYRVVIDLPIVDDLISDELDGHPASLVVSEFREHLRRLC